MPRIFHWGQGQRPRAGGGGLGRGQRPPPHQLRVWGSTLRPQWSSGQSPDYPKVIIILSLFSALTMAFPDTIILLIMEYHVAIGDKTLVPPPLAYASDWTSWWRQDISPEDQSQDIHIRFKPRPGSRTLSWGSLKMRPNRECLHQLTLISHDHATFLSTTWPVLVARIKAASIIYFRTSCSYWLMR